MCVGGAAEPAHGGCLHLTLHTKHTVSGRKFARLCVSAGYVWSADCASTASCRREQISQLLKRCPKLSWPPTRVPSHACALFHRAPRGFAVSATLFQTRTWDLFWGPSRLATKAKQKCYCLLSAPASAQWAQIVLKVVVGIVTQTGCFTEAHECLVKHTWIISNFIFFGIPACLMIQYIRSLWKHRAAVCRVIDSEQGDHLVSGAPQFPALWITAAENISFL